MTSFPVVGGTFARWQVTGVLGRGSMGVVFAALGPDGRAVALKVLTPDLAVDDEFRARFVREAERLAALDSPHVLRILDHGEEAGCLYLCTPLVAGGDLRRRLDDEGPLPAAAGLSVVAQVASGLADAHAAGVLHRDVKPGNVLLWRKADGDDFALLCDFGVARALGDETTRPSAGMPGSVVGTLGYVAPERHRGEPASVASDVYGVGCLLVAVLTGRAPYVGTDVDVVGAHLRAPVPQVPGEDPTTDAVNAVLRRCLAKDPAARHPSAAALRRDLLAAEAIARTHLPPDATTVLDARPGSPRRRGGLVAAALVLAAGAVGGAALLGGGAAGGGDGGDGGGGGGAARTADPPATEEATRLTCWQGDRVRDPERCPPPEGLAGMRWAFPSFDEGFDRCRRIADPVAASKVRAYFCPFANNPEEGVRYNEWSQLGAAESVADGDYRPFLSEVVSPAEGVSLQRWQRLSPDEHRHVATSVVYPGWPVSVDVQSRTLRGVEAGCRLVTMRSPTTFEEMSDPCGSPVLDTT